MPLDILKNRTIAFKRLLSLTESPKGFSGAELRARHIFHSKRVSFKYAASNMVLAYKSSLINSGPLTEIVVARWTGKSLH